VIHYHGTPITPNTAAAKVLAGRHAFVSFACTDQLDIALEVCQSFALDNGAFGAWRSGKPITNWRPYYEWVRELRYHPGFDFAVVPDVIDGDEDANDYLLAQWPMEKHQSAPVWHMHESIERLVRLAGNWPRVAIGSSGRYATVGDAEWWGRIAEAMNAVCIGPAGRPICKLHGLRMLNPEVFGRLPFSSADSTNVGQNIGIDQKWRGTYQPPSKEWRAVVLAERIESTNSAQAWDRRMMQPDMFEASR